MISWKNELGKKCFDLNIEPVIENNTIVFYCPKIPVSKEDIISIIPSSYTHEFIESIKPTTSKVIMINSAMIGMIGDIKIKNKKVYLKFKTLSPEIKEEIWDILSTFIKEDGYASEWEIAINDHTKVYNPKIAGIMEKNKIRDTFISNEDIMDLIISLNSSKSLEELLTKV